MTFPTDTLYKFLAVVGLAMMSWSAVTWQKDRSALQEELVVLARTSAAAVEVQDRILGHMNYAEGYASAGEAHTAKARELYAEGQERDGDSELEAAESTNRLAREMLSASQSLLPDYGERLIQFKQASSAASVRASGHGHLRWLTAIGFIGGLLVFLLSCLAWQRYSLEVKADEA